MTSGPGWIPITLASALEPGTSAGAVVDGREVVAWRDTSGNAHVWEDRCPHRGMRMSFGFVRGDHIACLYHGWQFDTAGQCRYIPAHPDIEVPTTIKVPSFATIEAFGVIWSTLTSDEPGAPAITATSATPVRSLYIDRGLGEVVDALGAAVTLAPVSNVGAAFTATVDGHRVLLAGQPVGPERAALHVVLLDEAGASPDTLVALASWGETFRNQVEAKPAARIRETA